MRPALNSVSAAICRGSQLSVVASHAGLHGGMHGQHAAVETLMPEKTMLLRK